MDVENLKTSEERLELAGKLAEKFKERSQYNPCSNGHFPFENIAELKETGYTSWTVPKRYGGKDITLFELVRLQEKIAEGDGPTALSIGWHLGIVKNLDEKKLWKEELYGKICEEIMKGSLLNGAATERATGSPTRGGRPETIARKTDKGWQLNGRKTYTTMSPVLDYFIVSASVEPGCEIGNFLVPRAAKGVSIEETWDCIAMSETGSHDLILEDVIIPEEYYVETFTPGKKGANGWLLHIPACYLGIAEAAKDYAVNFAKAYRPNSIEGTIIELPAVRKKIGEMELELMRSRYFLYAVAKQWDDSEEKDRKKMAPQLGAAKMTVTNAAINVLDLAMRVVGAKSLSASNPLQKYYRDVRAGLHNPPMDDMTIELLAKRAET
ncbi:acyl-CoA dehydrogenase family protein [Bacillus massilinigeriensis]|uniref:acyl-CoA dehydrogenase family protein n=1 Tax=Bacillus mediterraneensis TaxID=1805474 RepID=UPI0008F86BFD|nr:acyl-CoA dehydrogenase family protein [Bacillus mediterraneensis]